MKDSKFKLIEDVGFMYNSKTLNFEHPKGESISYLTLDRMKETEIKEYIKQFKFKLNSVY